MSKTIRFKLSGKEADYVLGTINGIRSYGVDLPGVTEIAKSALMETCLNLNKKVNAQLEKLRGEAAEGERTVAEAEGTDGAAAGAVGGDAGSDTEDQSEGTAAPETGGDTLAAGDGG